MYVPSKETAAFVSYGENAKMYTLRVITEGYDYVGREKLLRRRDYHVRNLSITREEAIKKAMSYCAEKGLKYISSEAANKELTEIKRRKHEEVQRQLTEAVERQEEERQRQYDALMVEVEEQGAETVLVFGKYSGQRIMDVITNDPEYIDYVLNSNSSTLPMEYPRSVYEVNLNTIYNIVKDNNIVLVKPSASVHVGNIKDKITLEVSVKRKAIIESRFGSSVLYVFEDIAGNVYTTYYSGSTWSAEIGDTGQLTATIKGHDEYKSAKQTNLTRAKLTVNSKDEEEN